MASYELSVVIAVQHAAQNLPEIMAELDPQNHAEVEFIICAPAAEMVKPDEYGSCNNLSLVHGAEDSLIPVLWKDGILRATAERVALTTAHCIPSHHWLDRLLETDMTRSPAIGGAIVNDSNSNARSWAIYLLRYLSFSPPLAAGEAIEIAADNALYRRADILQHEDLLKDGFWEPSFHRRFRQANLQLLLNPELQVIHKNRYSTRQFFHQRLEHGKAFGMERCESLSNGKRRLLILLSPLLPLVFLSKICLRVIRKRQYLGKLLVSMPWLMIFLAAWGIGEARGYLAGASQNGASEKVNKEHRGQ